MNLRNNVKLIGNLGADPEFHKLDSGKAYTRIRLATNERYRNEKGDLVTTTEWHTCVAWGKKAEVMSNLLRKGREVAVEGKLVHRSYEDKDGIKRYRSEIWVSDFLLLGKKEES